MISSDTNQVQYTGNDVTVAFSFPYLFLESNDLLVLLTDEDGIVTEQVLNTDYTVTGAGSESGGTVTFTTAPTSDDTVTIINNPDLLQETDYRDNDKFPAVVTENALDKLTIISQRITERLERAIKIPDGFSGTFDTEIPLIPEAYQIPRVNADADGLEWATPEQVALDDSSLPTTTKGDIIAHNGTVNARLPVGANGLVLNADSAETTGLKWGYPVVADGAITTVKIADSNVTTAKIADSNVTTAKINAAAITRAKIDEASFLKPNIQRFTSGSGTYGLAYYFYITSGSATAGATYTNNGQTFTVVNTISSETLLLCTSTGAPASSGTLTKSAGTGDATITFSTYLAPKYLRVKMVGGGGGGASSGGSGGGTGGSTTFGSSLLTCTGGSGGSGTTNVLGTGGTATVNSPAVAVVAIDGGSGQARNDALNNGGVGGNSFFGGGGGEKRTTGGAGATNTGGGGGGANNGGGVGGGGGGGAGGYIDALINSPSATYAYAVGAGGSGGGAAGGSGVVIVEEYFQ